MRSTNHTLYRAELNFPKAKQSKLSKAKQTESAMMFQRHLIQKHASNMTRSKCQSLLRRSLVGSLNQTAPMPHRHMKTMMMMSTLTDAEQAFVKEGILDERGLVQFDTLHNMQVRSCRVYADKDLFATYSATTQNFEWMTFAECKFICDGGEFVVRPPNLSHVSFDAVRCCHYTHTVKRYRWIESGSMSRCVERFRCQGWV